MLEFLGLWAGLGLYWFRNLDRSFKRGFLRPAAWAGSKIQHLTPVQRSPQGLCAALTACAQRFRGSISEHWPKGLATRLRAFERFLFFNLLWWLWWSLEFVSLLGGALEMI